MKMKSIVLFVLLSLPVFPADTTRSSVFKPKPSETLLIKVARPADVTYQLWEGFTVVRNANAGDPAAMIELAVRYLTGDGFTPDTARAFQLIQRAADKDYVLAHFNLGVFYHNGWGTEWNPFKAYKHFKYAAQKNVREASFVYALYLTDNLTVPRNWHEAYRWAKNSADKGYAPAKEILPELERYAAQEKTDSLNFLQTTVAKSDSTAYEPILLDFTSENQIMLGGDEQQDTILSLREILRALNKEWQKRITLLPSVNDSMLFLLLTEHAEWGVPEEFTVIGRCYEKGIGVQKDTLKAILNYLRAVRLESRHAPIMLINLLKDTRLLLKVEEEAKQGSIEALYSIACLALTEIYPSQQQKDIAMFLQRAAQQQYVPAMLELATAYFNGQIISQQKDKAVEIWKRANGLGSNEALVRLASATLLTGYGGISKDSAMQIVYRGAREGSLLAQVTLGICYERGLAMKKNNAEAVKNYRTAAFRGSRIAFASLKRMYDGIRPSDKEFQIIEKED